ncbi:DBP2_5 [Blepharisma stoltei]|uniref:RNA helicase n=1 Tax=Blepharisma stoltei TaxID=1481888 RepID=A0AAU9K454_9CILI|nr:unnamed protein product [Blepharisma stoltei]
MLFRAHRLFARFSKPTTAVGAFEKFNFPSEILKSFSEAGFTKPTEIQDKCWGPILKGKDLIGIAKTGSGKTLAFVAPAIVHINSREKIERGDGPIALVISPTRELALQTSKEFNHYGHPLDIKSSCVFGGVDKEDQRSNLFKGKPMLIATPGRLIDYIIEGAAKLSKVSYFVIDEVDKMLDMGFENSIKKIVQEIGSNRQTLMFSATFPDSIQKISKEFMKDPEEVRIGSGELTINSDISHKIEMIEEGEKLKKLLEILKLNPIKSRVLIFVETKKACDRLAAHLSFEGYKVSSIHSDKTQSERTTALQQFALGFSRILIATDLAARGLDVKDIKTVINFDMPESARDYVHRVGRTARAGLQGSAISFFTPEDKVRAEFMINIFKESKLEIPAKLQKYAEDEKKTKTKENPNSKGKHEYRPTEKDKQGQKMYKWETSAFRSSINEIRESIKPQKKKRMRGNEANVLHKLQVEKLKHKGKKHEGRNKNENDASKNKKSAHGRSKSAQNATQDKIKSAERPKSAPRATQNKKHTDENKKPMQSQAKREERPKSMHDKTKLTEKPAPKSNHNIKKSESLSQIKRSSSAPAIKSSQSVKAPQIELNKNPRILNVSTFKRKKSSPSSSNNKK